MKGVLVVLDGMGDLPIDSFSGLTPLESASTPNMDFFATRGEMGYLYPVKPGFVPESDEALVSLFGNQQIDSTRGQLEAKGAGIQTVHGDLAFRVNFATIDSLENKEVLDRRAGRTLTDAEAEALGKSLNKIKLPCPFVFKPTFQHRAVVVFKGGFSDNISGNDSTYFKGQSKQYYKVSKIEPLDEDENSQYSVNVVNEFIDRAFEILDKHPVNEERRKKGLLPANYLLIRGPGINVPKLKVYRKWMAVTYTPMEKAFSQLSGMKVFSFDYPALKGMDVYANLHQTIDKACNFAIKMIRKHRKEFDYAYIHIKETDLAGHDNKPIEKKMMIEEIDKNLFRFLKKFAPQNDIQIVVTADHSTPCKVKGHSADPVPVLFYNNSLPKVENKYSFSNEKGGEIKKVGKKFCERESRKGDLGRMVGGEMLKKVKFVR